MKGIDINSLMAFQFKLGPINITQEKYLFGDDEIRLTASGKRYDSYTIVANYTIYRTLKIYL